MFISARLIHYTRQSFGFGHAAINGQRLEASIYHSSGESWSADYCCKDGQAIGVAWAKRIAIICVHEDERTRLHFSHASITGTYFGGSCPASRHNLDGETSSPQFGSGRGKCFHRLTTTLGTLLWIMNMLQMSLISL